MICYYTAGDKTAGEIYWKVSEVYGFALLYDVVKSWHCTFLARHTDAIKLYFKNEACNPLLHGNIIEIIKNRPDKVRLQFGACLLCYPHVAGFFLATFQLKHEATHFIELSLCEIGDAVHRVISL